MLIDCNAMLMERGVVWRDHHQSKSLKWRVHASELASSSFDFNSNTAPGAYHTSSLYHWENTRASC
jgi:hypothetical protein